MSLIKRLVFGILVLLPMGVGMIVPLAARPVALTQARQQTFKARTSNDRITEIAALWTELAYSPWSGESWQRLGRLQLDLNQYSEAAASLENAYLREGLSIEGQAWLANAWISIGEIDKAKELLRSFAYIEDVDPFLFLQAALMQRSIKDIDGALSTLLRAHELQPDNGEISYQIALLLVPQRPNEALSFLSQASKLKPDRSSFCDTLSEQISGSLGSVEEAGYYLSIGQTLAAYSEWDMALLAFQKALELDPKNGVIWAYMAEAMQQNGQNGSEAIDQARKLSPEDEVVNGLSGLFFRRDGNSEKALMYLEKAMEINPQALIWEIEIGNTLAEIGNLNEALDHYQAATIIDSSNYYPWRALAVFCLNHNYEIDDIGLNAARRALQLNSGSPALMDLLGTVLMVTGNLQEAEIYFLQADQIDSRQSAILIHLGQLALLQGQRQKALDYFSQAMEYAQDQRLYETAKSQYTENGGID